MNKKKPTSIMKIHSPIVFSSGKTMSEIAQYIMAAGNAMNNDQDCKRFIAALRQAVRWAGVNWVAKQAGMTRHSLYYAVGRKDADPRFNTVVKLLQVFGVKLVLVVKDTPKARRKLDKKK